jgi:hypothetical protein
MASTVISVSLNFDVDVQHITILLGGMARKVGDSRNTDVAMKTI